MPGVAVVKFPIDHLLGRHTSEEMAEDLGVSLRTVERWIKDGVNWEQADRFACTICADHPMSVFGPEWAAEAHGHLAAACLLE